MVAHSFAMLCFVLFILYSKQISVIHLPTFCGVGSLHSGNRTAFMWGYSNHYNDVIMSATASQITSLASVCSSVYSGVDQREHQSSASLAFVRGIHRWPVNSPHKWPLTRKKFPFDDVIMPQNNTARHKLCAWIWTQETTSLAKIS